jgi:hypothetical protein
VAVPTLIVAWLSEYRPIREITRLINIPSSTLYAYKVGRYLPSASRYTKLANLYKRITYNYLRTAGANIVDAKRFSGYSPANISKVVDNYWKLANKIAKRENKDPADILDGIRKSRDRYEDYEKQGWDSP